MYYSRSSSFPSLHKIIKNLNRFLWFQQQQKNIRFLDLDYLLIFLDFFIFYRTQYTLYNSATVLSMRIMYFLFFRFFNFLDFNTSIYSTVRAYATDFKTL